MRSALALALLLALAPLATAAATARLAATQRLGVAVPLTLAPGALGGTTLGKNATSARTHAPPAEGELLVLASHSALAQRVRLRVDAASGRGAAVLSIGGERQALVADGAIRMREGSGSVELPARGSLTVRGVVAGESLRVTILAQEAGGDWLAERWSVSG